MRTITEAHHTSRCSLIPDPSIGIESVGTKSGSLAVHIDIANVYFQQCPGQYAFRSPIIIKNDLSLGAAI